MVLYISMQIPKRKPGKFSQTAQDTLLTQSKFDELGKELERLKKIVRPKAMEEVARLAETGDFSENAGYQNAKGRLRGINQRMLEIENELRRAEIIQPNKQTRSVDIGHTVTITNGEKIMSYQILGSAETNPTKGVISHTSPLGTLLMGRKVGEKIKLSLSNNKMEYTILKIE